MKIEIDKEKIGHSGFVFPEIVRNRYLCVLDIICVFLAFVFSSALLYELNEVSQRVFSGAWEMVVYICIVAMFMYFSGVYNTMWIFAGMKDYTKIGLGCMCSSAVILLLDIFIFKAFSIRMILCAMILLAMMAVSTRVALKFMHDMRKSTAQADTKRLLIIGAGSAAAMMLRDIESNDKLEYKVVGLIDDDEKKQRATLKGIPVIGTRYDIKRICSKYRVDEILLAIPSAESSDRKEIIEICNKTGCKLKTLPSIDQIIDRSEGQMYKSMRNIEIEDLLEREPVRLNNDEVKSYISGQDVLVTGGGGSIGSELCRQIMKFGPRKLIILDIYENNAYDLQMELNGKYPENKPDVVIASIRDKKRLDEVFAEYKPQIVFHAAAHKHVPLMESSPMEAVKNNVMGTINVAECADKHNVHRFVMISTDKAVNPTNIMGATKRICEMCIQTMQKTSKTEFVAVRFGNVLGSNGSVVPLFKKQIEAGGPVTVTDKRITRFFMTIPEAAQLVLQAACYAKGGEIFVLDMGEPVRIYDLAKNLIRLSGYVPDEDIKIEFCGLRPGEKLYEELLMNEEGLQNTEHSKIFIGKPMDIDEQKLKCDLAELEKAVEMNDVQLIRECVRKIVPTYKDMAG